MRIESLRYTEHFGSVRINDAQKVLELDSGAKSSTPHKETTAVEKIEDEDINGIEQKMAIVVPIKDEKLKVFEGVISAIPHECLIIVVSNSGGGRTDRFRMEMDTINQFCHFTQHEAMIIHQKDPALAQALKEAEYDELLGEDGLVRDGKSEGMVIGILMANLCKKSFVGFIDADNYIPGAVREYAKNFAAGFLMSRSMYVMVRNLWRYKVKISQGLYFKKWGRVSEVTNKYLNALISSKSGFETDIIKTGNAGEHAMSIELAGILPYASGFASETYELTSIFEKFSGTLPVPHPAVAKQGVDIFQIESRNPHLHEERGEEHLKEMLLPSLSIVYHSPLCDPEVKSAIVEELASQGCLNPEEIPPKPAIMSPPSRHKLKNFAKSMEPHLGDYSALEEW